MYGIPSHKNISKKEKQKIGPKAGSNPNAVEIMSDGTIRAKTFVMSEGSELGVRCTGKKTPMFQRKISENAVINYHIPNLKAQYEVSVKESFSVKNCFATIINKVKSFSYKKLGRYIHAPRVIRKAIDKLLKRGDRYVTTIPSYSFRYVKPYKRVTTLGPYNTDVKLQVSRDIDFITDLIVIKTGVLYGHSMNPNDNIVWVSPHQLKASNGILHTSTGINVLGDNTIQTGQHADAGLWTGLVYQVSSSDFKIKKGTILKTNNEYTYYNEGGGQQDGDPYFAKEKLSNSTFYKIHQEESPKIDFDTSWDGVIPEGAYFTIESWSTNDRYIGFDGEISVIPAEGDLKLDCSYTYESKGVGHSYEDAYENARKNCQKKFHKKLNKKLIDLGYRNMPSKMKRFNKMVKKSAKNEYDKMTNKRINNQIMIDSINDEFVFHGTRDDPSVGAQESSTINVPAQGGVPSSTAGMEESTSSTSTTDPSTENTTSESDMNGGSTGGSAGGNGNGGYY